MFNNLIKYSIKSFKRQRSYVIINILGLSIGIACSLLIALYVINEVSYDRYNLKKDRIYRLVLDGKVGGQEIVAASTAPPTGPAMAKELPEVEEFLRMNGGGATTVEYNNRIFTEDHWILVDSSFFDFFSVPVLKGDPKNLLNAPRKAVLSESTARKIFGDENPIDKTLKIGTDTVRYTISGVMADIPANSHFEADILVSMMSDPQVNNSIWLSNYLSTYLLLKPKSSPETLTAKMPDMIVKYVGPELQQFLGVSVTEFLAKGNRYRFFLQKLTDIHLDPAIQQEFKDAGDPKYLTIFGSIAILIILIAAINFMNLSTAQSSRRAKEVGIKKIGGSSRGMLVGQFLSESFILTFLALLVALVIIKLTLPYFNNLLGVRLVLSLFSSWFTIPALILFILLVGLLAGSYPAFFLSSFNPYEVLKGSVRNSMTNGRLRRILVVFQFAVSILLIVGTLIMYRQIKYMLHKDVGFNKEQLMVINRAGVLGPRVKAFKENVRGIPGVINIAGSTAVPGRNNNNNGYMMEGRKEETFLMNTNWVDYDYLETYGMTLSSGRIFNKSFTTDQQACLVNEAAIRNFAIKDVENTRFIMPVGPSRVDHLSIIGVVKDFNFESLRSPVDPYVFLFQTDDHLYGYLTVKLSTRDYSKTIAGIEKLWKEYTTNEPLQYYFLDADFENMYIQEKQSAHLAVIFSMLAILVAAMGLFGLTSFTVEQRTKEIGVRKAMGSSVIGIYTIISREIVILVSVSALIAWPVIYYFAGKWLENFYYRISLGALTFTAGLTIALGIALITVSYRVLRAAMVNPAQSLKYE